MTKGWLTPNVTITTFTTYLVSIPDNVDFRAVLYGAISLLADQEQWQKFGDATPEEIAEFWEGFLLNFWEEVKM